MMYGASTISSLVNCTYSTVRIYTHQQFKDGWDMSFHLLHPSFLICHVHHPWQIRYSNVQVESWTSSNCFNMIWGSISIHTWELHIKACIMSDTTFLESWWAVEEWNWAKTHSQKSSYTEWSDYSLVQASYPHFVTLGNTKTILTLSVYNAHCIQVPKIELNNCNLKPSTFNQIFKIAMFVTQHYSFNNNISWDWQYFVE